MTGPAAAVAKHFVYLTDPRADRGLNHDLLEMLFLALTATICGANSWANVERFAKARIDWFRRYIKLRRGVTVLAHIVNCPLQPRLGWQIARRYRVVCDTRACQSGRQAHR